MEPFKIQKLEAAGYEATAKTSRFCARKNLVGTRNERTRNKLEKNNRSILHLQNQRTIAEKLKRTPGVVQNVDKKSVDGFGKQPTDRNNY